jgi:DNA-binding MarR family transcriptional regulator
MDAFASESNLPYADCAPVLIVGSDDAAIVRARGTIGAFGLRIGAGVGLEQAEARLRQQASASAVWVELSRGAEGLPEAIARRINADASEGRCGVVVSARMEHVDALAATLDDDVLLIIDANDAERLRQLSDEVSRIAATLARLSTGPAPASRPVEPLANAEVPPVSAETIRTIIRARRLRARYFSEELFADPAWDMLLDLLQAEISHLRVPVSSLCIAAAVPATTALRWLKTMVSEGLFIRRADPHDGRRVFVELAPHASNALRRYFAEVGQVAPI